MQSLQSFFSRRQTTQNIAQAKQPVLLSGSDLKLVGGGLPRVGRAEPMTSAAVVEPLPRVG